MSLPEAYQKERKALEQQILHSNPADTLQFCADYYSSRLAAERALHLSAASPSVPTDKIPLEQEIAETMSTPFGVFGANANPFGSSEAKETGPKRIHSVIEEDETENVTSPTTPHFGSTGYSSGEKSGKPAPLEKFAHPFGGDASAMDEPPTGLRSPPNPESYPAQYNFARRTSVSAESLKPSADTSDNWTPPFHQKPPEQLARLQKAIGNNFLFSHLDDEQADQILGALVEKPIPAKDIKVISQGDAGDFFYVVEKGSFDVYVNPSGSLQPGLDGMGNKVGTIEAGGSFGELALMYNAPRAATVISAESGCTLWALDRVTFRRILMESTFARRRMYESFLEEVPLLQTLTPYERSKIADALETQKYSAGDVIIKEGDPGHNFYLLENGEADAYKGETKEIVKQYEKGDFFGELALLNDAPRAASVVATSEVKVATLGKSAFQRLLGPVEGIMRRTRYVGVQSGVEDLDPLHTDA